MKLTDCQIVSYYILYIQNIPNTLNVKITFHIQRIRPIFVRQHEF